MSTIGLTEIAADPRFVNGEEDDLRLQPTSPTIDDGDNSAVPAGLAIDRDGSPRLVDVADVSDTSNGTLSIVDMGAHEVGILEDKVYRPLMLRNEA